MKDSFFLVFSEDGIEKMNKARKPNLKSGQRGVEMVVTIPDAFFEQPFPEVQVQFDESDIMRPSVSVRVEETKTRIMDQFVELFTQLPENRREYVRDEIWAQNEGVWALFFHDGQEPIPERNPEDLSVAEIAKALEWASEQVHEKPELPPEYRE